MELNGRGRTCSPTFNVGRASRDPYEIVRIEQNTIRFCRGRYCFRFERYLAETNQTGGVEPSPLQLMRGEFRAGSNGCMKLLYKGNEEKTSLQLGGRDEEIACVDIDIDCSWFIISGGMGGEAGWYRQQAFYK